MKIAVCYSGLYREYPGWIDNHRSLTRFGDVFYSTWEGRPLPPVDNVITFPEPVMHYDPYGSAKFFKYWPTARVKHNPEARIHLNKQQIGHQLLVDQIGDYDVVIRMRYDIWIGEHDWERYIMEVHDTQKVYSFGMPHKEDSHPEFYNVVPHRVEMYKLLTDFIIMHPKDKMRGTLELHEKEELLGGEGGWYQILVEPYGHETLDVFCGGASLSRLCDVHGGTPDMVPHNTKPRPYE